MGEEDSLAAHRADVVLQLLMRRMTDEKSPVRRVVLQVCHVIQSLSVLYSICNFFKNKFCCNLKNSDNH